MGLRFNFPNTFHSVGIELQLEKAKCSDGGESAPYNDINKLKNRPTLSDADSTKTTTDSQTESVKPDSIKVSQHVDKTSSINENFDSHLGPPGEVLSDDKASPSDETETNCSNSQLNDEPQPDDQKSEESVAKNKLRGQSWPSQESDFEVEVPKSKPKSKSDKSTSKKDKVKVIPLDIEAEVKGMTEDPRLTSPCRVDDSIDLEVVVWPEQTSTDNKPDRKDKHSKKKHSKSHKIRNVSGDEKSHHPPRHTSNCSSDNSEPVEGNTGDNVKLEPVFETLNPMDVCQGVGLPPKLEIQVKVEIISPPASHTLTCSSPVRLEQPLTDDDDIDIKPVTDDSKSVVTIESASHDMCLSGQVDSPHLGPLTVNTDMTVVENVKSELVTPCSEISTVSPASTADTLNSDHGAKNTSSKPRDSITSVLDICNKNVSKSFKIPKRRQSSPPAVKVKSEPMKSPPARVSSNPYEDTRRAVKAEPQDLTDQKQVSSGRSRGHDSETESKEDRKSDNQKRSDACHGSSDSKSRHDSENSLDRGKISEKSPVRKSENRASDKRERREHKEHEKKSIVQKTDRGTHGEHGSSSRDEKYSKHPKSHESDERKPSKPYAQLNNNSRDKQRSPEKSRQSKLSSERSGEREKRSQSSNSTHKKDDKGE